jgi:flagellar motor switch/type III secretory pathway protein FliN
MGGDAVADGDETLSQEEIDALIARMAAEPSAEKAADKGEGEGVAAPAAAERAPAPPQPSVADTAAARDRALGWLMAEIPPRLRDLEVTIAVEMGRRTFTVREVLGWTAGRVVTFDARYSDTVRLVVNETPLAVGRVVQLVDGRLGVRVEAWVDGTDAGPERPGGAEGGDSVA